MFDANEIKQVIKNVEAGAVNYSDCRKLANVLNFIASSENIEMLDKAVAFLVNYHPNGWAVDLNIFVEKLKSIQVKKKPLYAYPLVMDSHFKNYANEFNWILGAKFKDEFGLEWQQFTGASETMIEHLRENYIPVKVCE